MSVVNETLLKSVLEDDAVGASVAILRGADVNAVQGANLTALHLAVMRQCDEVAGVLITAGADVNAPGSDTGVTPYQIACERGSLGLVRMMIAAGADLHQVNAYARDARSLLSGLIESGSPSVEPIIETRASFTGEELLSAVRASRDDLVEVMVSRTKNLDHKDRETGASALHNAIRAGEALMVKTLVAAGADVNMPNRYGVTPLHLCAAIGDLESMRLVRENHALASLPDTYGFTAMHAASRAGHTLVLEQLLQWGMDVNVKDSFGNTPLHRCADAGTAQFLIDSGANVNALNRNGESALHRAALRGDAQLVRLLLANGLDVNAQTKSGAAALHGAAVSGSADAGGVLLSGGANIDLATQQGCTALHLAKDAKVVALLVNAGADPLVKDDAGRDSIDLAIARKDIESTLFLLAKINKSPLDEFGGQTLLKHFQAHPEAKAAIKEAQRRWADAQALEAFSGSIGMPTQTKSAKAGLSL